LHRHGADFFLLGIPGLRIEACDIDPQAEAYFRAHPEVKDVPFVRMDVLEAELRKIMTLLFAEVLTTTFRNQSAHIF
jgi:hypothetical protein